MGAAEQQREILMKKILSVVFSLTILGLAGTASALTINSGATEVGGVDTLLFSNFLANSGDQTEVDWVNGLLNTTFTTSDLTKYTQQNWLEVDSSSGDTWAIDLQTNGGYFFIKTGNFALDGLSPGQQPPADLPEHFLYQNLPSSDWGVVSFSLITTELNAYLTDNGYQGVTIKSFDVTKFSHLGELDGSTNEVPEPATMLIFGTGLAALAGVRRKMQNNQ